MVSGLKGTVSFFCIPKPLEVFKIHVEVSGAGSASV